MIGNRLQINRYNNFGWVMSRFLMPAIVILLAACSSAEKQAPVPLHVFPEHCRANGGMARFRCVADTHKAKMFHIYERHRRMAHRPFSGEVVFRVHLVKIGKARSVEVLRNSTGSVGFAEELADTLRQMNFGPLRQDRIFRYPMHFTPQRR